MLFLELSYQLRKVVLFFSYSTHLNIYAKCLCLQYILFSEKKNSVFTFETSLVGAFGKILRITNINSFECMIKILRVTFELKISFTSLVIL